MPTSTNANTTRMQSHTEQPGECHEQSEHLSRIDAMMSASSSNDISTQPLGWQQLKKMASQNRRHQSRHYALYVHNSKSAKFCGERRVAALDDDETICSHKTKYQMNKIYELIKATTS
ncbi:hypothetical protein HELRODRAFT_166279 [Helobdella robusta]|uniref:Uncharacterized protein n=1 Tax=Helobdella robusta TaxID=6412 RepID=T1EXZ1_HELRO|nr:hypothetical protein HELRODRAFT_166279 [Helobdella robusta]ESN90591.1 hypothetical protein HELRODRAFT_166279 [Helobdella robusta]